MPPPASAGTGRFAAAGTVSTHDGGGLIENDALLDVCPDRAPNPVMTNIAAIVNINCPPAFQRLTAIVFIQLLPQSATWRWQRSVQMTQTICSPMRCDSIERKMELIIEQQATFAVDIAQLKELQRKQAASIDKLTDDLRGTRELLDRVIIEMHERFDSMVTEMRDGFNNLIVANEVTRKLAEDVGRLAIATTHRVAELESKPEGKS